jgi:hypothetical protein
VGVKYRCEIKRHPATDTRGCPLCADREFRSGDVLLLLAALVAISAAVCALLAL